MAPMRSSPPTAAPPRSTGSDAGPIGSSATSTRRLPRSSSAWKRPGLGSIAIPVDKDASDTELAVRAAIEDGADRVDLLGATGGDRLDHELANLMLLADPAFAGIELRAIAGSTTVRAVRGGERLVLEGGAGDLVTLLPIAGDADGVTTTGLRWPLEKATLHMGRSRGLSNVVVGPDASVTLTDGVLLVVETASTGDQP